MRLVDIHTTEKPQVLFQVCFGNLQNAGFRISRPVGGWRLTARRPAGGATAGRPAGTTLVSTAGLEIDVEVFVTRLTATTVPGACARFVRRDPAALTLDPQEAVDMADDFEQLCDGVAAWAERRRTLTQIAKHR